MTRRQSIDATNASIEIGRTELNLFDYFCLDISHDTSQDLYLMHFLHVLKILRRI